MILLSLYLGEVPILQGKLDNVNTRFCENIWWFYLSVFQFEKVEGCVHTNPVNSLSYSKNTNSIITYHAIFHQYRETGKNS